MNRVSRTIAGLAMVAALASMSGCGGGGIEQALAPSRDKNTLTDLVRSAFSAYAANAGMEMLSGALGVPGLTRQSSSEPGSDNDIRDPSSPYFDPYFGLWSLTTGDINQYATTYYLDEALTQEAGTGLSTWSSTEESTEGSSEIRILAGPTAGYTQTSTYRYSATDFSGEYSSQVVHPSLGTSTDVGQWDGLGNGTYSSRWSKDNQETEFTGCYSADGSWQTTNSQSDGFRFTLTGLADGSGSGEMVGPDPLLPATIVWDAEGNGTITWADGSTSDVSWFGIGGGATAGGDSGSTDGSAGDDAL